MHRSSDPACSFRPERQGRRRPGASPPNAVSTCSSPGRP